MNEGDKINKKLEQRILSQSKKGKSKTAPKRPKGEKKPMKVGGRLLKTNPRRVEYFVKSEYQGNPFLFCFSFLTHSSLEELKKGEELNILMKEILYNPNLEELVNIDLMIKEKNLDHYVLVYVKREDYQTIDVDLSIEPDNERSRAKRNE